MLKLEGSVAVALIFCSSAAPAREPEPARAVAEIEQEPPRVLHRLPLEADEVAPTVPEPKANQAASDGFLSPFTNPAVVSTLRGSAQSYAGYDGSTSTPRARAAAEGRLTNFLSLRVEFEHGPATGTDDRLSIGARLGILTQRRYGVDFGAGLFYQPKDFRQEGNIVGALMVARHFGRLGLFANGLFGSDSEGDDQSVELRLGSLYAASSWLTVGLDARSRMNLSEDQKRLRTRSVDWEMQAAPTAIVCMGQFSLMTLLGPRFIRETPPGAEVSGGSRTHAGLLAMAGAGAAF
jgi:hypothetical protein